VHEGYLKQHDIELKIKKYLLIQAIALMQFKINNFFSTKNIASVLSYKHGIAFHGLFASTHFALVYLT